MVFCTITQIRGSAKLQPGSHRKIACQVCPQSSKNSSSRISTSLINWISDLQIVSSLETSQPTPMQISSKLNSSSGLLLLSRTLDVRSRLVYLCDLSLPSLHLRNLGNIITRNYFKASQVSRNQDLKGSLRWYTIAKTQALTIAVDFRDLREKDFTTFQIQSIPPEKRKARDISTLDAAVHDGTLTSHSRKRKRRIEFDPEEEWNGFPDHRSS